MRRYRRPKNEKLKPLYLMVRYLADQVGVATWSHRYRWYKKMVDFLANQAMDARASAQDWMPTNNMQLLGADEWLENDVSFWVETETQEGGTFHRALGHFDDIPDGATAVARHGVARGFCLEFENTQAQTRRDEETK